MTETLLELKGLEVTFKTRRGTLKAVDDLSLTVNKGEILGIVGESGAGKSMTGAAIIGLIDPPGRVSKGGVKPFIRFRLAGSKGLVGAMKFARTALSTMISTTSSETMASGERLNA